MRLGNPMRMRCPWASSGAMVEYHDRQWGVPVFDDTTLFEMLILEGAQAGLSWDTILQKREGYRAAFDGFDPRIIADYPAAKLESLLQDSGIVRNRRKVESCVVNAREFLRVQESHGSFAAYLWEFVGGAPLVNRWKSLDQVPATTALSIALSKDLRKRGFKFVGPTICYAYMQSTGLVNDHLVSCFRHAEITGQHHDRVAFPGLTD